jgi:hypothetical protein
MLYELKLQMIARAWVLLFAMAASVRVLFDNGRRSLLAQVAALGALLAAIALVMQRDTHLPFLGPAAIPSSVLRDDTVPAGSNVRVEVPILGAKDGDRILYWGAKPGRSIAESPWDAYGDYANAGIASVAGGKAVLRFHCPARYRTPHGRTLPRHVHYRRCCARSGLIGRVETLDVDC